MKMMKQMTLVAVAALFSGQVFADEAAADLDVTMTVIADEGEAAQAVEGIIELPEQAADTARANAEAGIARANEAREGGQAMGRSIAEEARSRLHQDSSAEFRTGISAEAREQRSDVRAGAELGAEVRTELNNPLK